MALTIDRAMFITNVFANAYPEEHAKLWKEFLQNVPASQRSGYSGADNIAYIRYLKNSQNPIFKKFISENIYVRTLG